jgi:F-type H+-transporting ATPase subunit b
MELNATILIQAVILLALFAWLSPMLFSPLMKVFDERDRRIHGAANEAKSYLGAADEKTALVEQKTKEATVAARQILTQLREQAQAAEQTTLAAAREKATSRLDEARGELFEASETARKALKADANVIADEIVKKVLGRAA